ncbi:DNA mismatch repair protein MutS, connector domain-containing protein [Artemisia annua]|uniref:DNA mismatch repair protein MutS, connector domain-containing protein n=1 Tax=Artemisia annua TaxID=35608 RepID=A0A2U1MI17_ARTAN|nr:DNA mismatch repair protein MutS, connector domain-containing protein [Artemisia annua]
MKRQQSILSFFHKPPSTDQPPSNPIPPRGNPTDDVTGTDTPPEKEHRSFFAAGEAKGSGGGAMFNSIKHKFIRPKNTVAEKLTDRNSLDGEHDNIHSTSNKNNLSNGRDKESSLSGLPRMTNVIDLDETAGDGDETAGDRNLLDGGHDNIHSTSNKNNLSNGRDKESSLSGFPGMKNVIDLDETVGEGDERHPLLVDSDSEGDITGPETPGARPVVPRLKRVQVDGFSFGSATTNYSTDNSKRVKFSHDLAAKENVTPEDWNRQVDFWIDPKRVHIAEVNSRNRLANTISSLQGSRSLAATRHNLAEETKAAKEAAKKLEKELATTQQQVSQMMAFLSSQPGFADQFARAFSSSSSNVGNDDGEGNGDGDEE